VTALAPGRGELSFDYTDATMPNPDDPWDPIPVLVETTGPLPFTVVPEPGTLMRVAMLGVVLAGRRRRKNLRRAAESHVPRRRKAFQPVFGRQARKPVLRVNMNLPLA